MSWSVFCENIFKISIKSFTVFCFQVADAVAKGDSERAANAVIATAKAVDEVVAFSKARASISSESNGNPPNRQAKPKTQVQSTMCIMIWDQPWTGSVLRWSIDFIESHRWCVNFKFERPVALWNTHTLFLEFFSIHKNPLWWSADLAMLQIQPMANHDSLWICTSWQEQSTLSIN